MPAAPAKRRAAGGPAGFFPRSGAKSPAMHASPRHVSGTPAPGTNPPANAALRCGAAAAITRTEKAGA